MMDISSTLEQFVAHFGAGGSVSCSRAPGRVNLIGEHTDYNDGFVLPIAIDAHVDILFRPRSDDLVRVRSLAAAHEPVEFSISGRLVASRPAWGNYLRGVVAKLLQRGLILRGIDALISSSLPQGSGLSSSAALCVSFCNALLHAAGRQLGVEELAQVCQLAEHEFAGVPCGIMDQMIIASARADHAMLLDCRTLERRFIPLDSTALRVVIIDTGIRRNLSDGDYARRRGECEAGVEILRRRAPRISALRDVPLGMLESAEGDLSDAIRRRCRHVITENERVTQAAARLTARDYSGFGRLMHEGHVSLRDDFQVSIPELDFLVECAIASPGVFGARMTGGGFGGCVIALCTADRAADAVSGLIDQYAGEYGVQPAAWITSPAAGATIMASA